MDQEINESLLPGILREIYDLMGLVPTLKLVNRYGGVRIIYVPKKLTPEHELVTTLGWDDANKFAAHFGGEDHLEIPKAQSLMVVLRNMRIKEEQKNLSQPKLAQRYNLTERQIRKILCRDDPEEDQLGLF